MQAVGLKVGWWRLPRVRVWELKEMEVEEEEGGQGEIGTREVRVGYEGVGGGEGGEEEGLGMRVFILPPA